MILLNRFMVFTITVVASRLILRELHFQLGSVFRNMSGTQKDSYGNKI